MKINMKIKLKDKEQFGELLIKKGFTQRELARVAEISEPYANQIATGERNPGPRIAKKVCDALDQKFDDIFFICKDSKSKQSVRDKPLPGGKVATG